MAPVRESDTPCYPSARVKLAGADEIRPLGGVQVISWMAPRTTRMGRVYFVVGSGKGLHRRSQVPPVWIDLIAGLTGLLMVADQPADPFVEAVDVPLSAEHGPGSLAVLITTSEVLGT